MPPSAWIRWHPGSRSRSSTTAPACARTTATDCSVASSVAPSARRARAAASGSTSRESCAGRWTGISFLHPALPTPGGRPSHSRSPRSGPRSPTGRLPGAEGTEGPCTRAPIQGPRQGGAYSLTGLTAAPGEAAPRFVPRHPATGVGTCRSPGRRIGPVPALDSRQTDLALDAGWPARPHRGEARRRRLTHVRSRGLGPDRLGTFELLRRAAWPRRRLGWGRRLRCARRLVVSLCLLVPDLVPHLLHDRRTGPAGLVERRLAGTLCPELVLLESDVCLVDRVEQAVEGARLVGSLHRGVRDDVAEVEDDRVVEVEDHLGDRTTDSVLDPGQPLLRLLLVDPAPRRVRGISQPAAELVPQARRTVTGTVERVRDAVLGAPQLPHPHRVRELLDPARATRALEVLGRDPTACGNDHRPAVVLDVHARPRTDEPVLRIRGRRLLAHRGSGTGGCVACCVARVRERTPDPAPLGFEELGGLRMHVQDLRAGAHHLAERQVAHALGRVLPGATRDLERQHPTARLVEIDVADGTLRVAGLGEDPRPDERCLAVEDLLDVRYFRGRPDARAVGDHHRVPAERLDLLGRHDVRRAEQATLIDKEPCDGLTRCAQDDVLDLAQPDPYGEAEDRAADEPLALAHGYLLRRARPGRRRRPGRPARSTRAARGRRASSCPTLPAGASADLRGGDGARDDRPGPSTLRSRCCRRAGRTAGWLADACQGCCPARATRGRGSTPSREASAPASAAVAARSRRHRRAAPQRRSPHE